jgi:VIT1/CCC1 family predicted Fe2+/Mn2+ transporter
LVPAAPARDGGNHIEVMAERQPILSPVERSSEILFGILMALTFTGTFSVAESGRAEIRTMLTSAIGCNTAWGIVDAFSYLLAIAVDRRRSLFLLQSLRTGTDPARDRRTIADALSPLIAETVDENELEHLRSRLASLPALPPARLTSRDYAGAVGVFLLVFLSTLPLVVPFLLPLEPLRALRISNAIAIVMMFIVGYVLGRHANFRPAATGGAMVAIGAALVALTIALGG